MAVHFKTFDGEQVSVQWYTVLSAARADGVRFRLNEGKRTFERQQYFWNCYRTKRCNNGNLAARPSHNAPHIRTGRIDHAIDVESADGGAQRLARWMRNNMLPAEFTVRGEPWHIETTAAALRRFHALHAGGKDVRKLRVLTAREKKLVQKRYYHYEGLVHEGRTGRGPKYFRHLSWARYYKARIAAQMRSIRRAAKQTGWKWRNRGARYQVLKAAYHHRLDL